MIEYCFLLVVFLLLYIVECAVWVPVGAIAFRVAFNPKRPITLLTKLAAQPSPGIVFAIPFSLRSDVIVCPLFPLSISPSGIASCSRLDDTNATGKFVAFEDIVRLEWEQNALLVNGSAVAKCSEIQAAELVNVLKRLKKLPIERRVSEIEKILAQRFDPKGVEARVKELTEDASNLNLDCLILPIMIFAVSPIVVWRWGLAASWPFVLAYLIFNALLIAWDFRCADQDLFPTKGTTRWSTIATILLSPPTAARAMKYLARDIGSGYHPMAFAASRCSDADFRRLASWMLRRSMFEPKTYRNADGGYEESTQWFRLKIQEHILALVHAHGDNPEEIIAPNQRESDRVESYCPRCLSQYVISEGLCSDCGGVSLLPFDPSR